MGCQHTITKVHLPSQRDVTSLTNKHKKSQALAKTEKKAFCNSIQIIKAIYVSRGSTPPNPANGTIKTLSPNISIKKKYKKQKQLRKSRSRIRSRPLLIKNNSFSQATSPKFTPIRSCFSHKIIQSKSHFFRFSRCRLNGGSNQDFQKDSSKNEKQDSYFQASTKHSKGKLSFKISKFQRKTEFSNYSSHQTLNLNRLPPIFKPIGLSTLKSSQ